MLELCAWLTLLPPGNSSFRLLDLRNQHVQRYPATSLITNSLLSQGMAWLSPCMTKTRTNAALETLHDGRCIMKRPSGLASQVVATKTGMSKISGMLCYSVWFEHFQFSFVCTISIHVHNILAAIWCNGWPHKRAKRFCIWWKEFTAINIKPGLLQHPRR